jgi:threonine/homoserine/homoserine lactone efflux protein
MTFELWAAYAVAAWVVLIVPGPTVMLVVSYALAEGRRATWSTVAGVALGDFTAMTLSLLGLGALMAASAAAFTILKWAGAAYLVFLGVRLFRATPDSSPLAGPQGPARPHARSAILGHAFAVTALNPKGIVFFVAFLPQFLRPAAPLAPQVLLLGGTFLLFAILNATGYALLAGSVRDAVRRPAVLRGLNRLGGSVMIGAGLLTALLRRA